MPPQQQLLNYFGAWPLVALHPGRVAKNHLGGQVWRDVTEYEARRLGSKGLCNHPDGVEDATKFVSDFVQLMHGIEIFSDRVRHGVLPGGSGNRGRSFCSTRYNMVNV
jgi:hypothetical protein